MTVIVRELDLSKADSYTITNFDLLRRALKREKKYRKDLLYRGFNGEHISKLLAEGQDNFEEYLSCASNEEINDEFPVEDFCTFDIFSYALDYENPAVAVFDSRQFHYITYGMYEFKNPKNKLEALVAVYRLKR